MDIVLVAQFMGNIECFSADNNRFAYLAKLLVQENQVEIVTTDFVHMLKRHVKGVTEYEGCKVTCLHEKGYPRNVCLQRFASHKSLANEVRDYLSNRKKPDLIYCAIPSLDVANEAAKYAKRMKVPFVVDIQDLWPEAFQLVLNIPVVSKILFYPMTRIADSIYASADHIVAVSKTYAERGLRVNKRVDATIVYLGTDGRLFKAYLNKQVSSEIKRHWGRASCIRLVYAGTLGHSYDLPVVFEAMRRLDKRVLGRIELMVMGDGPRMLEFKKASEGLPVVFTGRLSYSDMVWGLGKCDVAVNPIVKGSAASIINKHMDYAMAGLPVINTQESKEYRNLLDEWESGINCECGDAQSIANAISRLIEDDDYRNTLGTNSRNMGETLFDRNMTYIQIVDSIKKCINSESY